MNKTTFSLFPVLITVLLAAGFGTRLYAAWHYRFSTNSDIGINALMARHISQGTHYPVFFYGQSYMGTMEAFLSAPFYRLFGHGLFQATLGSVLISFLAHLMLFLCALELGGRKAGLIALILGAYGSSIFFYYFAFLGYPSLLFTGLFCIYSCIRILKSNTSDKVGRWWISLGIAAGLGWWSNQLVVVFLAPCILLLLLHEPRKCGFISRAALASLAFIMAGSPWFYMVVKDPRAMLFIRDVGVVDIANNLSVYGDLFLDLFDFFRGSVAWAVTGFIVLFWCVAIYLKRLLMSGFSSHYMHLYLPALIMMFSCLFTITSGRFSHVPAVRYLLPAFPAILLIISIAIADLYQRGKSMQALIVLISMSLSQVLSFPLNAASDDAPGRIKELHEFVQMKNIDALWGDFTTHWINFAAEEKIISTSYPHFDRYRPYRAAAATAERIGIMNNFNNFDRFMRRTGANAKHAEAGSFSVQYDLMHPLRVLSYIPATSLLNDVALQKQPAARYFMDGNIDTPPQGFLERSVMLTNLYTVQFDFQSPLNISGLHILGPGGEIPSLQQIDVVLPDGMTSNVFSSDGVDRWFWSGPRAYCAGPLLHGEYRFAPVTANSMMLTIPVTDRGQPKVTEILIISDFEANGTEWHSSLDKLKAVLDEYATPDRQICAPRWVSEHLHARWNGFVKFIHTNYYRQYDGFDRYESPVVLVEPSPGDLLLLNQEHYDSTRQLLQDEGYKFIATNIGPWQLITVTGSSDHPRYYYWTEFGLFYADALVSLAQKSDYIKNITPNSGLILFDKKAALHDLSIIDKTEYKAGDIFTMRYLWHCASAIDPAEYAVFVHFKTGGKEAVFQDDHVFLYNTPLSAIMTQQDITTFEVNRNILIPENVEPGVYTIHIGIYNRVNGDRLKPSTHLPNRKGSVETPASIKVL